MCRLFCPKGIFFDICVLSQCLVYWIQFQNIHTFTYKKYYFIQFCCLVIKSSDNYDGASLVEIVNGLKQPLTIFANKFHHWCLLAQQKFVLVKTCWRRVENVLETSCRRHLTSMSWRCLDGVFEDVLNTSCRRFWKTSCRHILKTSWKIENATLKTSLGHWKTRNVCWDSKYW